MEIKINGKNYQLRVTLGAQLLFRQDTGKEVSEMSGVEEFGKYLFYCAKSAAIADGTEFAITQEQFLHAFDQDMLDQWEVLQQEYVEKKTKLILERSRRYLEGRAVDPQQK
ncbi:hypothetical protein JZU51_00320 [bacterium]|nr:hypothetical protein [bacterium]